MRDLGLHIAELLLSYPRVEIPSLGYFEYRTPLRFKSGEGFDREQSIVFTAQAHIEKSPLALFIAHQSDCSLREAEARIEEWVKELKVSVYNGSTFHVAPLGTFQLSKEETIAFSSGVSRLIPKSAYGFGALQSRPLVRSKSEDVTSTLSAKWKYAAAAAAVMITIGLGSWNLLPVRNTASALWAGLSIASNAEKSEATYRENILTEKENILDASDLVIYDLDIALEEEIEEEVTIDYRGRFEIVCGVFREKSNAIKLKNILRKKAIKANLHRFKNQLTMVSVDQFQTKEKAEEALFRIRKRAKGAWIKEISTAKN